MREVARNEPALTAATLTALATAIIGLLVAFNVEITDAQRDAILGFIAAAFPIIIMLGGIIRQYVSPTHKVEDAYTAGLEDAQPPDVEIAASPEGQPVTVTPRRTQIPKGEGIARFTNVGR